MVTATGPALNPSEKACDSSVDQNKHKDESGGGDRAKVRSKKTRHVCRIAVLDGSTIEVELGKSPTGQDAFDEAAKKLNLLEKDYFGLSYHDAQNRRNWLDLDKSIRKQVKSKPWVFSFEVRFYPPDPSSLQEDITRYYLFLQCQNDVVSAKIPCSFNTCAVLGSYMVQAQTGDYDSEKHSSPEQYLSGFSFAPQNSVELLYKVAELHKLRKGQTPAEAELHYLENATKLPMYGVDMHAAKTPDNEDVYVGVCSYGILVFKNQLRLNRFIWPKIIKISYVRNNFSIKLRPEEFEKNEAYTHFKLASYRDAERLWKSCVEHHTFFRLMSPEAPSKQKLFPFGWSHYRYSGRTQYQTRLACNVVDRPPPNFQRTLSGRLSHKSGDTATMSSYPRTSDDSTTSSPIFTDATPHPVPRRSSGAASDTKFERNERTSAHYSLVYEEGKEKAVHTQGGHLIPTVKETTFKTEPLKQQEDNLVAADVTTDQLASVTSNMSVKPATRLSIHSEVKQVTVPFVRPVEDKLYYMNSGLVEETPLAAPRHTHTLSDRKSFNPEGSDEFVTTIDKTEESVQGLPGEITTEISEDGRVKTVVTSTERRTIKKIIQKESYKTFILPVGEDEKAKQQEIGVTTYNENGLNSTNNDANYDEALSKAVLQVTMVNPNLYVERIEVQDRVQ